MLEKWSKALIRATAFAVAIVLKRVATESLAFLRFAYFEFWLIARLVKVSYLARVWLIGRRKRLPIDVLLFGYRPRYGDLLWLYVGLISLGLAMIDQNYHGGIGALADKWSLIGNSPQSRGVGDVKTPYPDGVNPVPQKTPRRHVMAPIEPDSSQYFVVDHVFGEPFLPRLRDLAVRLGIVIRDDVAIARAVDDILDQKRGYPAQQDRDSGQSDTRRMVSLRVGLTPYPPGKVADERAIDHLQLALGNGLELHLRPEQNLLGQLVLETRIGVTQQGYERFLVRGTLKELLESPRRYQAAASDELPLYLKELLLLLSRQLDAEGGLNEDDTITALYQETPDPTIPQLMYVEWRSADKEYHFIRYQTEQDPRGYLYDEGGLSFVTSDWGEPIEARRVSSGFGVRLHPIKKFHQFHNGVDYAAPIGTPVRATRDGLVLQVAYSATYGHYIRLLHADGYATLYAHLREAGATISPGYPVRKGDVIGYSGNSGLSTGPHLHYEVILNSRPIDPTIVTLPEIRLLSPSQQKELNQMLGQRRALVQQMLKHERCPDLDCRQNYHQSYHSRITLPD